MTRSAPTVRELRTIYRMAPIPEEGGYFALGPRTTGLSCITALLTDEPAGFSALHVLTVDEGWQWLAGSPIDLVTLDASGTGTRHTLDASTPQVLVPAGTWQGAMPRGPWSLLACWCAPAFTDGVFRLGIREELVLAYPGWATDIERLTRG